MNIYLTEEIRLLGELTTEKLFGIIYTNFKAAF